MTLIVSIIPKDTSIDTTVIEKQIVAPHNDLFGFEDWRYSLWGSKITDSLGCELVHSLREGDVYVFDANVVKLKKELEILSQNVGLLAQETGIDVASIEFRIKNALEAIRVTENHLDQVGVALW